MQLQYFDIHSHLNFSHFDEDREDIIEKMQKEGVFTVTIGTDKKTSLEAIELAEKHDNLYATIGVHPTAEDSWDREYFEKLLNTSKKIIGIGECGLDYYRIPNTHEKENSRIKHEQKKIFIEQLEFAKEKSLPVVFHMRSKAGNMDAHLDTLEVLQNYKGDIRGDFHFCTSDVDIAKAFLDLGHFLSFDGPITFAREYEAVIKMTPLDRIMAETDAPFAAPEPYRGKRNNPLYVKEVYKKIAEIKKIDFDECQQILNKNAKTFWLLK